MSAAYKCNRCGLFFEAPTRQQRVANPDKLPPPMQIRALPILVLEPHESSNVTSTPIDMCSRCAIAFDSFLNNKPTRFDQP